MKNWKVFFPAKGFPSPKPLMWQPEEKLKSWVASTGPFRIAGLAGWCGTGVCPSEELSMILAGKRVVTGSIAAIADRILSINSGPDTAMDLINTISV